MNVLTAMSLQNVNRLFVCAATEKKDRSWGSMSNTDKTLILHFKALFKQQKSEIIIPYHNYSLFRLESRATS